MNQRNATHDNDDKLVRGPQDVPAGLSDEEQLEFWETHEITEEFLAKTEEVPADERPRPRPRDRHGTLRLDKETVEELSALADERGVPLQTLARELLLEGVRRARRDPEDGETEEPGGEEGTPPARRLGFDAARGMAGNPGRRSGIADPFGIPPKNTMALNLGGAPMLAAVMKPLGGIGGNPARGLAAGLRPGSLLGPAYVREAVRTTQQIVAKGILQSHADALSLGSREALRRLSALSMAGLQARLAREAMKGMLGPVAGLRAPDARDPDEEDEGRVATAG